MYPIYPIYPIYPTYPTYPICHIFEEKDGKNLSKLSGLSSHYGMKEYLSSEKLNVDEKCLLFNLRTRMVDVRSNYKTKYGEENLNCTLCETQSEESQEHLLQCPELSDISADSSLRYQDIFGGLDVQIKAAKHWSKLISLRKIKMKEKEISLRRNHVH